MVAEIVRVADPETFGENIPGFHAQQAVEKALKPRMCRLGLAIRSPMTWGS